MQTLLLVSHVRITSSTELSYDITNRCFPWVPLARLQRLPRGSWGMPAGSPLLLWLALFSQASACLLCFSSAPQRLRICQQFLGHHSARHAVCLEALQEGFRPHTFMLRLQMGTGPSGSPAGCQLCHSQPCLLLAGFQREARRFQCSSCSIVDCQLPIDCPVQDVHKQEGDGTLLSCEVKFQIPTDSTFRWKFAKDLRTEDLSLFQDLQFGFSRSLLIQPTLGSHHGTIACEIAEEEDVLIRKFYYLNVDHQREEAEGVVVNRPPSLQEMLSAPDALSKKNVILLISGIALSSMALTLAAL
uniref:Ig-like domain-containing protein n=1 Tax=Varanus komodoensis TaxID=61221 RepID=A0A8D2JCR6_VARKO